MHSSVGEMHVRLVLACVGVYFRQPRLVITSFADGRVKSLRCLHASHFTAVLPTRNRLIKIVLTTLGVVY